MRIFLILSVVVLWLGSPLCSVFAQDQAGEEATPAGEALVESDILPDGAILLGEGEENGIIARAWLYRAPEPSGGQQQQATRLFLRFLSAESNVVVEKGLVAFKIEDADGVSTPAFKMEFKKGYFVAGLADLSPGFYILHIGCKLEDDKKRQFRYELTVN